MLHITIRIFGIFFLINCFNFSVLESQINNTIVVKVGRALVTSIDVQNEILTNLVLGGKKITQESVDTSKGFAIKNLISKRIKSIEIEKYKIKDYSKENLREYMENIAKTFDTDVNGLKKIFSINNIDYDIFVNNRRIELLWNTLIYQIYKNQTNVNIIEVKNEVESFTNTEVVEYNLSEIEILKSEFNENRYKEILESIETMGFDFVAKKISISLSAEKGGSLGWIENKSLSKNYQKKIMKLNIKDISLPILNKNSVSILKINDKKITKNKIEFAELQKKIILKKREEKLNLFSRSHFSNLENSIQIDFK